MRSPGYHVPHDILDTFDWDEKTKQEGLRIGRAWDVERSHHPFIESEFLPHGWVFTPREEVYDEHDDDPCSRETTVYLELSWVHLIPDVPPEIWLEYQEDPRLEQVVYDDEGNEIERIPPLEPRKIQDLTLVADPSFALYMPPNFLSKNVYVFE
jgi:hypothetical protein